MNRWCGPALSRSCSTKLPRAIEDRLVKKIYHTIPELKKLADILPDRIYNKYPNHVHRWFFLKYEHFKTGERIIVRVLAVQYKEARLKVRNKYGLSRDWELIQEHSEPVMI